MVAEIMYPELRDMYGHHGTQWVCLDELAAEPTKKEVVLAQGVKQGRAE